MIKLTRNKWHLKILELRYPEELTEDKNFDVMKIYSFKNLRCKKGWGKKQVCTMQINLIENEENILKNMSKNYRKHIRTEKLQNIKISMSKNYKKIYNELYLPLCKRKKLKPYPLEYLQQGDFWIAELDNQLLSSSIIFTDHLYATQSFTASKEINYNGNRFLIWTAIKHYKNNNLKYFNFGGGESDYKKRFGTKKEEVWLYTKYISKKAKILNWIRNLLKRK